MPPRKKTASKITKARKPVKAKAVAHDEMDIDEPQVNNSPPILQSNEARINAD